MSGSAAYKMDIEEHLDLLQDQEYHWKEIRDAAQNLLAVCDIPMPWSANVPPDWCMKMMSAREDLRHKLALMRDVK